MRVSNDSVTAFDRVDQKDTEPVNKRLSRSLTSMFKNKPNFLNKLKGRKSSSDATNKPTTMAIQNETYHGGSINTDDSFEGSILVYVLKCNKSCSLISVDTT